MVSHHFAFLRSKKAAIFMVATIVIQAIAIRWLMSSSQSNGSKCAQELAQLRERPVSNKNVIESDTPNSESKPTSKQDKGSEAQLMTPVEIFRRFALLAPVPSKTPYNLANQHATYYSEPSLQQDQKLDELLKQRERGFFIEVGAYDGERESNSLFFEKTRGWTGLLIEANPRAYRELIAKDRKAWITNACIALTPGRSMEMVTFLAGGMVGGVLDAQANPRADKFQELGRKDAANLYVYPVTANCFALDVMLDAINVTKVDMFSLDVEGNELEVLRTIDFGRFEVEAFTIEANGRRAELVAFLEPKGYRLAVDGPDLIFVRPPGI